MIRKIIKNSGIEIYYLNYTISNYDLFLYYYHENNKVYIKEDINHFIIESKNYGKPINNIYSYRLDKNKLGKVGQDHIHIMKKGNGYCSINQNGTQHDRHNNPNGITIPNEVTDFLRIKFPNIKIPKNNFLEWVDVRINKLILEHIQI